MPDVRLLMELPPGVFDVHSDLDARSELGGYTGTDYLLAPNRCESDPEMYRIFAHAVLGWHRRLPKAGGDRCLCGASWRGCPYVKLAEDLLWPVPGPWYPDRAGATAPVSADRAD